MIVRKSIVTYRVTRDEKEAVGQAKGRVGQTLYALVEAGARGVTALEMQSWAFRLADYVHDLRHEHLGGFDAIQTIYEPHEGGEHARYLLIVEVEIIEITLEQ